RLDQFADAVHDEGNLCAMPAGAPRPGDRADALRVLVLQPGPAARRRRFRSARCAAAPERRTGEADRTVGGQRHDIERRRLSTALWRAGAVVGLALLACGPALADPVSDEALSPMLRLPSDVRPTHYALTMTIVPGKATAPGEITIDIALDRPHSTVWLNAVALTVSRV